MTAYKFRVDFLLGKGNRVFPFPGPYTILDEVDGARLELFVARHPVPGIEGADSDGTDEGMSGIHGSPYRTKEEALAAALRVKETVLIWALNEKVSVDFSPFGFYDDRRRKGTLPGQPLLSPAELGMGDGIEILPVSTHTLKVLLRVIPNADRTREQFAEEFRRHHSETGRLTSKQLVAIQLFNGSSFDKSEYSRFISMISAVEALIDSTQLESQEVLDGLADLVGLVPTLATTEKAKERLKQKLEKARELSIARGGKQLVTELLGGRKYGEVSAAKTFERLYKVRSKLVHEGHSHMEHREFQALVKLCREFVSDLILASIEKGRVL